MENTFYSPKGFQVAGVACGLKTGGQKDLAVFLSQTPCQVAGVFTSNKVKAAPVVYDQQIVQSGKSVRAVVANAGNANACTGEAGMQHAQQMAAAGSQLFDGQADDVLVLSTGVIGVPLPVEKVTGGIESAAGQLSSANWLDAAHAIMTTDTEVKIASVQSPSGYTITGVAKGAGMISPNMATMLSVICTDAALTPEMLDKVPHVWAQSFNRIVVDGDMSTNDTVLLLANGAAGVEAGVESDFYDLLSEVSTQLAKAIVQDGEGATKLVTVTINHAATPQDADTIARAIATSPLCKTAFYGADPNWGRVVCAAGYAQAAFDSDKACLTLTDGAQEICLFSYGQAAEYDEPAAIALMETDAWELVLDLGLGDSDTWVWTCDLSHEYVTINGHYRT